VSRRKKIARARANAQAEQTALARARKAAELKVLLGELTARDVAGYVRGWLAADQRLRGNG